MRTIHSLEKDAMIEFIKLFPSASIFAINISLYNGTETGRTEFEDLDVVVSHEKKKVSGKTLETCLKALDRVDYNQIQNVSVTVVPNFKTCSLDMLSRELTIQGEETLSLATIKRFSEQYDLRKTTLLIV